MDQLTSVHLQVLWLLVDLVARGVQCLQLLEQHLFQSQQPQPEEYKVEHRLPDDEDFLSRQAPLAVAEEAEATGEEVEVAEEAEASEQWLLAVDCIGRAQQWRPAEQLRIGLLNSCVLGCCSPWTQTYLLFVLFVVFHEECCFCLSPWLQFLVAWQ